VRFPGGNERGFRLAGLCADGQQTQKPPMEPPNRQGTKNTKSGKHQKRMNLLHPTRAARFQEISLKNLAILAPWRFKCSF